LPGSDIAVEIREFAESILFSATLEEKLRSPGDLTDLAPAGNFRTPKAPTRPDELRFAPHGTKYDFPTVRALESEPARGRLLHFFANHELLATELMALALLKFPKAPKPFRAGLLRTLLDEQTHTKMYLGRLRQLGVSFGEFPVNGFFWRAISDMKTPLDYVSRLSLTFEQANLDYSRLFADRFRTLGDGPSEKLMERIYRDEIAHVGFGLEWFRQWKDSDKSDWEAFRSSISIPFSPNRAKGEPFNREGRVAAGLDREFIDCLDVYSRSKGRPPQVFHFNPFAESHISRGATFAAGRHQAALARDLETLPIFLCRKDDVVMLQSEPDTAFLARLKEDGFDLPEFEILAGEKLAANSELRSRKLGGLRPWAWSPDSIRLLSPLLKKAPGTLPHLTEDLTPDFRALYSKATATQLLREVLVSFDHPDWLCEEQHVGVPVHSMNELSARLRDWRRAGFEKFVAKMPFGVAGSNMLRIWEPELAVAQSVWLERAISSEGSVVIEPWLDRVLDFSFQSEKNDGRIRRVGTVRMINDHRGQYRGSVHHPRFTANLDAELGRLLTGSNGSRLKHLHSVINEQLADRLHSAGFRGPFGIDAFVFNDGRQLRLKPVVEINPRHTMGRLTLELMRHASNGSSGRLELISAATLKKAGLPGFVEYVEQLRTSNPTRRSGSPKPRIDQGVICLNDPARASACLAVFQITRAV
jgi:uncharacterized ferritin-like protein (DUF455 family)